MSSLQISGPINIYSSSSSSYCSSKRINASIHVPNKLPKVLRFPIRKTQTTKPVEQLSLKDIVFTGNNTIPPTKNETFNNNQHSTSTTSISQLYAILEAVSDRIEMHNNIGEQRNNWHNLLLNSVNMITLTASTIAGIASVNSGAGMSILALKLSSTLLFSAATGMLVVMSKLQPSQLAEEQRNASRLFKQLQTEIQTKLALSNNIPIIQEDVNKMMEKVLAADKAYPLPLIGVMIQKFPQKFEPAVWWPNSNQFQKTSNQESNEGNSTNGWTAEVEMELREIIKVTKEKDMADYVRLGNIGLKINKVLAISGPLLTGIAALSSPFVGNGSWGGIVAVTAGALASAVNAIEHGGQVGMVLEMYRNCAGFFKLLEDSIGATLNEKDLEKRENGELFKLKVALQLGRSLPQLEDIAAKSASSRVHGTVVDEFASKLF